jgi:hypothetical protein
MEEISRHIDLTPDQLRKGFRAYEVTVADDDTVEVSQAVIVMANAPVGKAVEAAAREKS